MVILRSEKGDVPKKHYHEVQGVLSSFRSEIREYYNKWRGLVGPYADHWSEVVQLRKLEWILGNRGEQELIFALKIAIRYKIRVISADDT